MDVVTLADDVKNLLTPQIPAGSVIERVWVPRKEVSAITAAGKTLIEVVPGNQDCDWNGRAYWKKKQRIQVGIWQPIANATEKSQVDAAVLVVDGLADFLRANADGHNWTPARETAVIEVQIAPLFDPKLLDEKGLFASVITAMYLIGHP